ncbi:MAG: hypothetical protein IPJ61_21275 [Tessaracoccus sp.]|uniref:hypothetical protein n=1 Tax=Tessaracoccus sp. TaxID=1971211 RepID=UPI001ED16EC0|nr:hypothetical protein [Tessaracoccus sp.]MBK7823521.1 hypothetical protein [Tessaracoccus sp.]
MAGFFGGAAKAGEKRIAAFHAEIETALAEAGMGTPKRCTVGQKVVCDGAPDSAAALGRAKLYTELSSRLDLSLVRRPVPDKIDRDHPPPPDFLDEAALTIVVTDGMQASAGGTGGTNVAAACAQGADPGCLTAVLRARADEGFGVWMVGVLLPFSGNHYVERPLSADYFARTAAHVADMNTDPRKVGFTFSVKGPIRTDQAGNGYFPYTGYKPLLILVFSRDVALGRRFVNSLERKLKNAPLRAGTMKPDDSVMTAELAPLDVAPQKIESLTVLPLAQQQAEGIDPPAFAEFRIEGTAPVDDGLSSKFWCGAGGKGLFTVSVKEIGAGTLPPYLVATTQLRIDPKAPFAPVRPAGGVVPVRGESTQFLTGLNCAPLAKGHTELRATVESTIALDATAADAWWNTGKSGWSSEDNWQMPERLYGLDVLVRAMLDRRTARPHPIGTLHVHVQRD